MGRPSIEVGFVESSRLSNGHGPLRNGAAITSRLRSEGKRRQIDSLANVPPPSPLWGEGRSTFDHSSQVPLFPEGRRSFTGRQKQSQRKVGGQLSLTPGPSPQRGEGSETFAARIIKERLTGFSTPDGRARRPNLQTPRFSQRFGTQTIGRFVVDELVRRV